MFAGAVIFGIGGAVQTFTTGFAVMVIGRVISGLGVGLLSWVSFYPCMIVLLKHSSMQDNRANLPERNISPKPREWPWFCPKEDDSPFVTHFLSGVR